MLSPEELVRRARVRCKPHRQPRVGGFCRECLLAEIEQAIAEEHPELERGDVFELVQEWLRAVDEAVHWGVTGTLEVDRPRSTVGA